MTSEERRAYWTAYQRQREQFDKETGSAWGSLLPDAEEEELNLSWTT